MSPVDPRTPVLIGVGEASERVGEAGYRALSPVLLGADAARAALVDTHCAAAGLAAAVTVVAAVRQFEISTPRARAPLGRSTNFPRSVARRIGADPARAVLAVAGGQSPQALVTEFAREIAAGADEVVLVVGAEAISTQRHLVDAPDRPDFTEHREGTLEDRGFGVDGLTSPEEAAAGLVGAAPRYALLENARRSALGLDRATHRQQMASLLAPFGAVAAGHPHAAVRVARTAEEIATPTARNRPVVDPHLRFMIARDQVNQAAAVLLTSVARARSLGVPPDRWVFLRGHADLVEPPLLHRPDLAAGPAAVAAVRHALDLARVDLDGLRTLDLYSCFPIAVHAVTDAVGLRADDPRGLTVTGGLPFFGGPGNGYALHAVAETVRVLRAAPGSSGLVGAAGGFLSKYSVGVYSTEYDHWREDRSDGLQADLHRDLRREPPPVARPEGVATIESFAVVHDRAGDRPVVVGRLRADGRRFLAAGTTGDTALLDLLTGPHPFGAAVRVRGADDGPHVTTEPVRHRTHPAPDHEEHPMSERIQSINESILSSVNLAVTEKAVRDVRVFDRLRGKVAIIVGGASGMGAAESRAFVAEGATVLIADIQDDLGKALAEELGPNAVYQHLDTRSDADWDSAVAAVTAEFGAPTVLVNNAGVGRFGLIQDTTAAEYLDILDIMLVGSWRGIKAVTPSMHAAGGGSIICLSSLDGTASHAAFSGYSSAKFGVRGLVRAAALELAPSHIRVNSIIPGLIDTPMIRPVGAPREALAPMEAQVPVGAAGDPSEIARAALFLASDDSAYITGTDLTVDGGVTAKVPLEPR